MKLTVGKGMDQYLSQLQNLEFDAPEAVKEAVYEGANIVADAVRKNINNLPTDDSPYQEYITALRTVQKRGLAQKMTAMRECSAPSFPTCAVRPRTLTPTIMSSRCSAQL